MTVRRDERRALRGGQPRATTAVLLIALLAAATLAISTYISSTRVTHGFASYYAAGRAVIEGRFAPWVYDDAVFGAYLRQVTGSPVRDIYAPNTPAMALLAAPVARLPHRNARGVWLAVVLFALFTSVQWLVTDALARQHRLALWLGVAVLVSPVVFANIRTAQAYPLILAAVTVAAWALLHRRDLAAGVALGLACAIKPTLAPWLLVLLCQRRVVAVLSAAASALLVVVVSMPFVGAASWLAWPGVALAFAGRPEVGVTAYQTTIGFTRHLCVADPQWNAGAPLGCAGVASWLPLLVLLAATAVTCLVALRRSDRTTIAASVCLSLLALPIAEDHQFVSLAVPLFFVPADTRRQRVWLAIAVTLMLLPEQLTWVRFTEGWWSLLAYPRLYATWILWGCAVLSRAPAPGPALDALARRA